MPRAVPTAPAAIAVSACLAAAAHAEFIVPALTVRAVNAFVANPGVGQDSDSASTTGVETFTESVFASAPGGGRIGSASASQNSRFEPDRIVFTGGGTLAETPAGGPEITTRFKSDGLMVFTLTEPTDYLLFGVSSNAGVDLRISDGANNTVLETRTIPSESIRLEGSLAPGTYGLFFGMNAGGDEDPSSNESFTFAASYSFQFIVPAPMTAAPLFGLIALQRRRR
ncbi:MAG: hypothetical protein AAF297_01145 [Planctomycetota bacterium]